MEIPMYATKTTGYSPHVNKTKDTKIVANLAYWGSIWGNIVQDTTVTVDRYVGLSYADALSLLTSTEESTLNGVTRPFLGDARLISEGGAYVTAIGVWGVKVNSTLSKTGDSNLYEVQITTTELTVRGTGEGLTLTLL